MERMTACVELIAHDRLNSRSASGLSASSRFARRLRGSTTALGLLGILLTGERGVAQNAAGTTHLTVQPRTMTIGTSNPASGEYPLSSVKDYLVTVPSQCTGTHPCPLVVFLPADGDGAKELTNALRPAANKYGVVLLAASTYESSVLDAALKEVLGKYAIDPIKMGIFGRGVSGVAAMHYGTDNPDVFSRTGVISGKISLASIDSQSKTIEYYIGEYIGEHEPGMLYWLQSKQQAGAHMKVVMNFRGPDPQAEDYDFWGRWLLESWATPNPDSRAALPYLNENEPELTSAILKQMTTFWTSFMQEPDSIKTKARLAHLREVGFSATPPRSIIMMDTPAMAAAYPSVAADLKKAGLTAAEHDSYRLALAGGARITFGNPNYEFVLNHPDEFLALWSTGMWHTP